MKKCRILVAEDDPNIREGLAVTVESEGYDVTVVPDGNAALKEYDSGHFGLVLLDVMMPGKSGYDLCRIIRAKDEFQPVIMLTAKGEEIDKVVGLKLGADDYITKPFGIHELLARIEAVLRRSGRPVPTNGKTPTETFQFGGRTVNTKSYKLIKNGVSIDLSEREVHLLVYFNGHPGEVLSRDTLLNAVWGIDYFGNTRTLDQHVAQLRKKIEDEPANPHIITTIHGVGYRYNP
jgi:DNA-binding response OmpR family regulator